MNKNQIYSNNDFNRAAILRDTVTNPKKISFIPIFNENFFISEVNNAVIMDFY